LSNPHYNNSVRERQGNGPPARGGPCGPSFGPVFSSARVVSPWGPCRSP